MIKARKSKGIKPIFKQWMYSYICVAIIPIMLCCGIYLLYENTLLDEMEKQNEYVMNTVKRNSEHVLSSVKNLSFTLSDDLALEDVLMLDSSEDYWGDKAVYEISEKMKSYGKYTIGYYSSIYIYIKKTDVVISDMGVLDSKQFYETTLIESGKSYEEWKKSVSEKKKIKITQTNYRESTHEDICRGMEYLYPIKDGEATIAIIINENAVFGDILNTEWGQNSEVYLYNSDDKLILSNSEEVSKDYLVFSKASPSAKKERLIALVSDDSTNWKIVTEVDEKLIFRAKYILRWSFALFILIGLIISSFVIRKFLIRNYKPVSGLLELVKSDEKNEFIALKKAITDILAQNSMLSEENELQSQKLHKMILEKTLKSNEYDEFIYTVQPDVVNILFKYSCVSVAIFKIAEHQLFDKENNIQQKEENELIDISIGNLVSEICKSHSCTGEFLRLDKHFVCIINYDYENDTIDEKIIAKIIERAKELFNITIYYTLSSKQEGMKNLSKCYQEALEVYKYQRIFDEFENKSYQDYKKGKEEQKLITHEDERKLINVINSGNMALIKDALVSLFGELNYHGNTNLSSVVDFVKALKRIFIKEIYESKIIIQKDKERLIENLQAANNLKDLYVTLIEITEALCGDTMTNKPTNKELLVENIKKYIEKNYQVGTLSVSIIADEFKLNTSYVIKMFKEETGMTLFEYLTAYRVEKAIWLIKETTLSFEEIAQKTGFNHIRTFNRNFKKITGVSPINYRK